MDFYPYRPVAKCQRAKPWLQDNAHTGTTNTVTLWAPLFDLHGRRRPHPLPQIASPFAAPSSTKHAITNTELAHTRADSEICTKTCTNTCNGGVNLRQRRKLSTTVPGVSHIRAASYDTISLPNVSESRRGSAYTHTSNINMRPERLTAKDRLREGEYLVLQIDTTKRRWEYTRARSGSNASKYSIMSLSRKT